MADSDINQTKFTLDTKLYIYSKYEDMFKVIDGLCQIQVEFRSGSTSNSQARK